MTGESMPLRRGVHASMEAEANRLLHESLIGVTSHSAKSDILTPWKETERRRREVYSSEGVVDPATRRGVFHRAVNTARPELNSRDGVAPARSRTGASLRDFVESDRRGALGE